MRLGLRNAGGSLRITPLLAATRREAQSRLRQKNEAFKSFEDLREVGGSMSFAMSSSRESQCLVGSEHYIRIQLRRTPRGQPACDRSNYCNRRDHRCHRRGVGRLDAEQQ